VIQGQKIINHLSTDARGAFLGKLEPGTYEYVVITDDRPRTQPKSFTVAADQKIGVLVQMDPPATLAVSVVDEQGRRAPVKIQLLARDDRIRTTDGRDILYSLAL